MEAENEKFFESLAGAAKPADDDYEVTLAKAESATLASRGTRASRAKADLSEPEGQLTVDVYQTPTDIVVESAIAGVRPEDIDINVTPDSIVIRGEREHERHSEGADYIYQECYWGRFARSIILPQEVEPEGADVRLKNGILTIRLPKANKRRSRKLSIRTE